MSIWRKLALGLLSPLFVFLLFATAFDVGFVGTATHPAKVKKLVADSGIYSSIVPNLLNQQKTISTPLGDINTSDPSVQAAAVKAVSPQVIQKQGEAAIDSIYQWLDGRTTEPQFSIGLAGDSTDFASSVAGSVQQKLATLPACSNAQSLAIIRSGSFDAVNATCLPRGITAADAASLVKIAIASNQGFLNQVSINPNDIKSASGQSFFQQPDAKNVPKQYQWAKKTPFILIFLTILTGAGVVLLSRSWPAGLRHIGVNLLVVGLVMLVFSWLLNRTVNDNLVPKIKIDNAVLQQDIRTLVSDVAHQIDRNYWLFGGVYTGLGIISVGGGEYFRRRQASLASINQSAPSKEGADKSVTAKRV